MRTFALLLLAACAGSVKPDEMSAAGHRREADKERAQARAHLAEYEPGAVSATIVPVEPTGAGTPIFYPIVLYNPTSWHLDEADRRSEHARQHDAAAHELERFEEAECKEFPPETRVACPVLGGVRELRDLPWGVRLTFIDGVRIDAVVAHMRCHYAYARTHGFAEAASCPLYMKGVHIERGAGSAIEITGDDDVAAKEIQRRARQEVRPRRPSPATL